MLDSLNLLSIKIEKHYLEVYYVLRFLLELSLIVKEIQY